MVNMFHYNTWNQDPNAESNNLHNISSANKTKDKHYDQKEMRYIGN